VRERCEPRVTHFEFSGIERARINPAITTALRDPALAGVIICPSNPYVSVDPILSLPGFVTAMRAARVPVIAVSPIIGGEAVKGPTAKMMRELSVPATAAAVAAHYRDKIDGFIIDQRDAAAVPDIARLGIETTVAQTLMVSLGDRTELARAAIEFASRLNHGN
jgi:LPPG:FO 2-phospho-L-lactate transferase